MPLYRKYSQIIRIIAICVMGILLLLAIQPMHFKASKTAAQSVSEVDLALILAVDCSHSVSNPEFDLQMQGLAKAFSDPEVIEAIGPNGVAVMLIQWSGADSQMVSVPWTIVNDENSALRLAEAISSAPRVSLGKTSISAAIDFSITQFSTKPIRAYRQVLDISADGINNDGVNAQSARDRALAADITINGLTILNDVKNLDYYFMQFVTGGPGNFIITTNNYEDYSTAIKQKLLREIKGRLVS